MGEQPRLSARTLRSSDVPKSYGVYAWYHNGEAVYAGRAVGADGLRERVWGKHMAVGPDLSRSSLRRNVCDYLGIADTGVTRARPPQLTAADVKPVNEWIRTCEVTWIECDTVKEAKEFERKLLAEWMPPLSRR